MNGAEIAFSVGRDRYTGRVDGNTITGTGPGGAFSATKK
jgi:hypothetical protein